MKRLIETMDSGELALVAGGVTQGPDGKSCTEHDMPDQMPVPVELDFSGTTIEIDPSI